MCPLPCKGSPGQHLKCTLLVSPCVQDVQDPGKQALPEQIPMAQRRSMPLEHHLENVDPNGAATQRYATQSADLTLSLKHLDNLGHYAFHLLYDTNLLQKTKR